VSTVPQGLRRSGDAEEPAPLCEFCAAEPVGPTGHSGLAQQAHRIPPGDRSLVTLECAYCRARWVRRRVKAAQIEWLRIAG
jgi:hypothetical protein